MARSVARPGPMIGQPTASRGAIDSICSITSLIAPEAEAALTDQRSDLDARAAELDTREADVAAREAAVTATEQAVAATQIGIGTCTLGVDVEPGT